MHLDLPTIITYSGAMACVMGLILEFLRRSFPPAIQGWSAWMAGALVAGVGVTTRIWLRYVVPEDVAIAGQNVCLIMTAGLFLAGTCRLFAWRLPRHFLRTLLAVAVVGSCLFFGYESAPLYRRLFARSMLVGLYGYHAWVVLRQSATLATRLTAGMLVALTGLILLRTVSGYLLPQTDGLDVQAWLQTAYAAGYSATDVLIPVCAILMASEKLRRVLERDAMHDSLTGALTRRALFHYAEGTLADVRRRGAQLCVLMLDLDHFKAINDQHGHHVGDRVLRDFADRMHALLRRPAVLARYGGEEFVVLLPDTCAADAAAVAQRILASASGDASLPRCHVSIGIAAMLSTQHETLETLLQRADQGLYRAKTLGRNRFEAEPA